MRYLLDVHADAEVRPPATGTWQLPPTPHKEPAFGKRWTPADAVPAK
jgi:acetolactate synthase-1/2/3 large subunit